jgi:hypothetical protein
MMKSCLRACVMALDIALLSSTGVARAETTQSSTIVQIQVLASADEKYESYHGVIWMENDKAKFNYRWGGEYCQDKELEPAQVQLLFDAFREKYRVTLRYTKQGNYRCVTGFMVSR